MPVCSTNRIPHSTCRSGIDPRPGYLSRRSHFGGSDWIRSHSSSDTIHGEALMAQTAPKSPTGHGHQNQSTSLCEAFLGTILG